MDAAKIIEERSGDFRSPMITKITDGKVLVKMVSLSGSWTTPSGTHFTIDSPFQLCDFQEAEFLIGNNPDRFIEGDPKELKKFYGLEE